MAVQNDHASPNIPNSPTNDDISPPAYAWQSHTYLKAVADEIRDLKAVNIKIATRPPRRVEFVWSVLLQVFAVLIGASFGVFALLGWIAAKKANSIAHQSRLATLQANQLALISYCLTVPTANSSDVCTRVQGIELTQIATLAGEIFGALLGQDGGNGNGGKPSPATGNPSGATRRTALVVGLVAVVTGLIVVVVSMRCTWAGLVERETSFKQHLELSVAEEKRARTAHGKKNRGVAELGVEVEPKDMAGVRSEEAGGNVAAMVTVPGEEEVSEVVEPVTLPWHRGETGERDRHSEDGRV